MIKILCKLGKHNWRKVFNNKADIKKDVYELHCCDCGKVKDHA